MTLSRSSSKEARRIKQTVYEFEDGEVLDAGKIAQKSSKPGEIFSYKCCKFPM